MFSNRVALAVVGGACALAAGTGAFLATRQSVGTPASAMASQAAPSGEAPLEPVQETETVVEDAPAPATAEPAASTTKPAITPAASQPARASQSAPSAAPSAASRAPAPVRERAEPSARRSPDRPRAGVDSGRASASTSPEPARRTTVDENAEPSQPSAASRGSTLPATEPVDPLPAPENARRTDPEPVRDPEPRFEELVVPSDSVIGLELTSTVSSETARIEDRVDARVTRDVTVDGRVAVPAGSRVRGAVTLVDRGGKVKERARLGVRFHTLVLADGTTLPIQTDTVFREGESPAGSSSAKIGGAAIGGAVLGAIFGGAKGAVIGGTTGAAGGTAAVMAGGRRPATLAAGSTVTVRVLSPVPVSVERE